MGDGGIRVLHPVQGVMWGPAPLLCVANSHVRASHVREAGGFQGMPHLLPVVHLTSCFIDFKEDRNEHESLLPKAGPEGESPPGLGPMAGE